MSSTLNKFGVPLSDGRGGILMPLQQHRFRVRATNLSEEYMTLLCQQTVSCDVDMKNKTVVLKLRQPVLPEFLYAVAEMGHARIVIDFMDGACNALFSMLLHDCKMKSHTFRLDYASGDVVYHTLEYDFTTFFVIDPKAEEKQEKYDPQPGWLTPQQAIEIASSLKKEKKDEPPTDK
jgi:hypothetical protein